MFRGHQGLFFQKCIGISIQLIFSHINFSCGSDQSLFLSRQLKIASFSTELRLLIYTVIYIGIPVVDQNHIMQRLYKHRHKKTCLMCQIGSYLLGHPVQSLSVKGMNCYEFRLEKKCQFVVLSVIAGLFQKPTAGSKLLSGTECGFIPHQIYMPFILLLYNYCVGWRFQWAFKICRWKKKFPSAQWLLLNCFPCLPRPA